MGCTSYNCDPLDPQVLNDCGELLNGSGAEVVVFSCGNTPTDPTDGTEVNALITAGDAVLFKELLVELPEAAPQDASSYRAGGEPRTSTVQRTVSWIDSNVNEYSHDAYDAIDNASGQTVGGLLVKLYEEDFCLYIVPNATGIVFKGGLTGSDADAMRYVYTGSWKNKLNPRVVAEPTGVFT
jgi:hypothetical protein